MDGYGLGETRVISMFFSKILRNATSAMQGPTLKSSCSSVRFDMAYPGLAECRRGKSRLTAPRPANHPSPGKPENRPCPSTWRLGAGLKTQPSKNSPLRKHRLQATSDPELPNGQLRWRKIASVAQDRAG